MIELLITVSIISVLAGSVFAILNPSAQLQKSQDAKRKGDLTEIQKALDMYYQDNNAYPASTADFQIQGASWGSSWKPYLTTVPQDPNSSKYYVYYSPDNQSYYLYSSLDNKNDSQTCNSGNACVSPPLPAGATCGSTCNYGVSSSNASITQLAVMPTGVTLPTIPSNPTSAPGGPTSTPGPTATPMPPTPTPTPTSAPGLTISINGGTCPTGDSMWGMSSIADLNGGIITNFVNVGSLIATSQFVSFQPPSADFLFSIMEYCTDGKIRNSGPYVAKLPYLSGFASWDPLNLTLANSKVYPLASDYSKDPPIPGFSETVTGTISNFSFNGTGQGNLQVQSWSSYDDVYAPYERYLLNDQPNQQLSYITGVPWNYMGPGGPCPVYSIDTSKPLVMTLTGFSDANGKFGWSANIIKYADNPFPTDISWTGGFVYTTQFLNNGDPSGFVDLKYFITGGTSPTAGAITNFSGVLVGISESGACSTQAVDSWKGSHTSHLIYHPGWGLDIYELWVNPDPNVINWNQADRYNNLNGWVKLK